MIDKLDYIAVAAARIVEQVDEALAAGREVGA